MMDDLLKQFGLTFEDLDTPGHAGEREALEQMLQNIDRSEVTVERIKDYIMGMRTAIERELIMTPETEKVWLFFERPNRKALILKARLSNYMEFEAFLATPEEAKAAVQNTLKNLKSKVNY